MSLDAVGNTNFDNDYDDDEDIDDKLHS